MWAQQLNPKGLSQGDILADLPIGAPWAPLVFLGRDTWTPPKTAKVYYPKRDALESFKNDPGGLFIAKGRMTLGLVITHNCDLDDAGDTPRVLVAPIALAAMISDDAARKRILEGRRRTFVGLPALPGFGDSYADLRSIAPVDRVLFTERHRVCSMTDDAVLALRAQLIDYFARVDPGLMADALARGLADENKD